MNTSNTHIPKATSNSSEKPRINTISKRIFLLSFSENRVSGKSGNRKVYIFCWRHKQLKSGERYCFACSKKADKNCVTLVDLYFFLVPICFFYQQSPQASLKFQPTTGLCISDIIFILHRKFTQMQNHQNLILYEDASVQVTQNEIVIKKYFFPIPIDKKIFFHQISDVFILSKTQTEGLSGFNPFNPSPHSGQARRVSYIELWLKDSKSKPTFSPHDPQKVFKLIQTKLQNEQFKENINLGMDNAKSSAKGAYSGFLGKIGKIVQDTTNKISYQGQKWSDELKHKSNQNRY